MLLPHPGSLISLSAVRTLAALALSPALILLTGCNTVRPLPPVDLTEQGWAVLQGQAIWKPGAKAPELAGEVLLATKAPGRSFVQFTKTPFPLVTTQTTGTSWEARIPVRNQRYSGRGRPPQRLLWLYLPKAMAGEPLPGNLRWQRQGETWRLENTARSEYIEGFFAP
jgi:hypothetical protein